MTKRASMPLPSHVFASGIGREKSVIACESRTHSSSHYPSHFFSVTAITVRENGENRQGRLSVTVPVRVEQSGID